VRLAAALAVVSVLAGCGGPPAPLDDPLAIGGDLYVDWDRADWRVDRYLLISAKDFATSKNLGPREPARAYREALTYSARWDSVSMVTYLALETREQIARRKQSRAHLRRARTILRSTVNHHWNEASRGYLPNLNAIDHAPKPVGIETAVTSALTHLVDAVGLDPTNVAAWRDLAYFTGAVGDRDRQHRALTATLAALDLVPPRAGPRPDVDRLRRDTLLDLAWLSRELQQPALTLAYLDHVEPWLDAPGPERTERRFEADVLRGLALADQGAWLEAVQQARRLPRIPVVRRAMRGGAREGLRWQLDPPLFEAMGHDRTAWPRRESDFGRRWVKAVAGAPSGDMDHTLWLLGAPPTDLEFPPRLAWRFWQDQGRLYARAGQTRAARNCFQWAAMYRPYMAFFPLAGSQRSGRLATPGASQRYFTGYGLFFLCGDRGAFERDTGMAISSRGRRGG
jgi:hypothetical protein